VRNQVPPVAHSGQSAKISTLDFVKTGKIGGFLQKEVAMRNRLCFNVVMRGRLRSCPAKNE
jgi:hypothetical protein